MSDERPWVVMYYNAALYLTTDEYVALQRAAHDDPVEAVRMADRILATQTA